MTQPPGPSNHTEFVDPEQFAADYLRRAEQMYADSVRQTRALQALAAEATSGPVSVRVGPAGRLDQFRVEGGRASAAQLTQGFAEAYREGVRLVNTATAQHSGGVAEQVMSFGPPAAAEDDERRRPPRAQLVDPSDDDAPAASDDDLALPSDDAFDTLLEKLDQGEPEDLDAILNDPEFQRLVPPGEPDTWQTQLEREVRQISRHADQIGEMSRTIVGEHSTRELTIEVTTAGSVESLRFHPPVGNLTTEEVGTQVLAAYGQAATDARRRLTEALDELGVPSDHE